MFEKKSQNRVLMINPPFVVDRDFIDYPYFTGLGVMMNAAVFREAGIGVSVADAQALSLSDVYSLDDGNILVGCETDRLLRSVTDDAYTAVVVGLSPFIFPRFKDAFFADFFKNLRQRFGGAKIIAADCYQGGMHYLEYDAETFLDNYSYVDAVVKYECESSLVNLVISVDDRRTVICDSSEINPDDLPFPAWDLISTSRYYSFLNRFFASVGRKRMFSDGQNTLPAVTSRGCPNRCSFCSSNPGQEAAVFRPHSVEYIERYFSELKNRHGAERIAILDGCANHDVDRFDEIIGIIKKLGLRCEIPNGLRADKLSEKTLKALSEVTDSFAVSAESADDTILRKVIKKGLRIESVERVAEWSSKLSFPMSIHYMIGHPGETMETMNRTLHHAIEMKEKYGAEPLVQPFVPLPGTRAHRICLERGLLKDFDERKIYSYFNLSSPLNTPDFDADAVSALLRQFRRKLESSKLEKVIINLTYKCENNCRFCAIGDREKMNGDFERYLEHLRRYRLMGVEALDLDGGEPTLYPQLFPLIACAKKLGYTRITVTTNGRALADRSFASALLLSGITDLLISIHGHESAMHDYHTRRKGSFEETTRGIANAVRLKPRRMSLAVNTMITDKNASSMSDFMEFIHGLGVKKVNVQFLTPFGLGNVSGYEDMPEACRHLVVALEKWRLLVNIEIVNAIPCQTKDYFQWHEPEVGKFSRVMVFADSPAMNLAMYLDQRRRKTEICLQCQFSIVCSGFYEYGGDKLPMGEFE